MSPASSDINPTNTPRPASPLQVHVQLDVPVAMRDGVVLRCDIHRPAVSGRYPVLLTRTPYNKAGGRFDSFVRAGYVVVAQDFRGRYASDGQYNSFLIPNTRDAEDGYDTVQWLAEQPFCNGRVGTFGTSYPAWAQWVLAQLRPPALKAMAAFAIPPDLSDIDFTQGSFRPARRVHWLICNMNPDLRKRAKLPAPHTPAEAKEHWKARGSQLLNLRPWTRLPDLLVEPLADEVRQWMTRPAEPIWELDQGWQNIEVPNLHVTGWYDHCHGIGHHRGMQQHARTAIAREESRLIIGPWNHVTHGQRQTGPIDFGPDAQLDLTELHIQWFDHWLKNVDTTIAHHPSVSYFVMGKDTDSWQTAPTWPPPDTQPVTLWLDQDFALSEQPATSSVSEHDAHDAYDYDPHDPMPTLWSERLMTEPSDRQLLDHRQDVLHYRSAALTKECLVVGEPVVVLHASSSALDTDFFARLIDESPEGPALDLCMGMVRARHRDGLDRQDMLEPNVFYELTIELGPIACLFKAGHRIRLDITSSDYPNYDRNHNTGADPFTDIDMIPTHQRVARGKAYPSRVMLPCLG